MKITYIHHSSFLVEKGIDMDVIMDATDLTEAEIREIEESILLSR